MGYGITDHGFAKEENYDRKAELQAFDDTKAGVKGLADSGITKIPRRFIHPAGNFLKKSKSKESFQYDFPVIDLDGIRKGPIMRKELVKKAREASEKWGFFQVVNHGIPVSVLEEMIAGVHRFFDQDFEVRKEWYTRDATKRVVYNSNFDLFSSPAANWRDTAYCVMAPNPPNPEELPPVCRDIMIKFSQEVAKLGSTLFEILSEALGLNPNYLNDIGCSLVINIGDLLQLMSNDKFISVEHRVLANDVSARVSVASFFRNFDVSPSAKVYGPIEDLLSDENPAKYRATTVREYLSFFHNKGLDGTSALTHFRLQ
ncbi:OLC1v1035849C1 [Oldenlandia corymbosa var. corymbosa]|uniref:OLC1v1035849C1 n=1 Tax=Oldenlandia corymbosa var. corymbosa TaxID=529605 RepID=A0AAV1CVC8_OLDCO|nr:OLC1v1035849C1 [Oldenlandia corymbosa var. corymbosa]